MSSIACLSALFLPFDFCVFHDSQGKRNADIGVTCFSCDVYQSLKILVCWYSLIFMFALLEKGKTVIVRVTSLLCVELCGSLLLFLSCLLLFTVLYQHACLSLTGNASQHKWHRNLYMERNRVQVSNRASSHPAHCKRSSHLSTFS